MTTIYVDKSRPLPERAENDLYRTELSLIRAALEAYYLPYAQTILDPGAGDGRWGAAAREFGQPFDLVGVELAAVCQPSAFTDWYPETDYLRWTWPWERSFDLVIGNPPYRLAEAFIRKSWDLLTPGGRMVFLLPLQYMASTSRFHGLWTEIPPVTVAVCSRRPSFYGGRTNGTDYGLFVWDKDRWGMPAGKPRGWQTTLLLHEREKSQ